ncbi:hypothetical protein IHE45_18G074100 [Dioscorea alata]|uniref:Uncharacterized protein n=1 Tax=Dioscorea alata TaxID=55571 RepID=A0ACB7U820_DIOAL|nr:hypothetical protein IHE45_18G074100 [Dioscorea alata]
MKKTKTNRNFRMLNPIPSLQEISHREPLRRRPGNDLKPRPRHSLGNIRTLTSVIILSIEQSFQSKVTIPWSITIRVDEATNARLHDNGFGVLFPWTAKVAVDGDVEGGEGVVRDDAAVVEDEAGGFMRVDAAVGGDDGLLVGERAADDDDAVLDDGGGVAEDEVDGAGDDAAAVELAVGLSVESVLVAFHAAVEEDGLVGLDAEGDGLVFDRAGVLFNFFSKTRSFKSKPMNLSETKYNQNR